MAQGQLSPELMFCAQSGDSFVLGFFLGFFPLCGDFSQVNLHDPGVVLLSEMFPQPSVVLDLGPAVAIFYFRIVFALKSRWSGVPGWLSW